MRWYLDRLFRKPIEILGYMRQSIPGNWKLYIENLKDPYHAGLLHQLPMVFGLWSGTVEGGSVMDKEKRHEIHYSYFGSEDAAETEESYKDMFESDLALKDRGVVSYREEAGDNIGSTFLSLFPCSVFQQFSNSLATRQVRPRGRVSSSFTGRCLATPTTIPICAACAWCNQTSSAPEDTSRWRTASPALSSREPFATNRMPIPSSRWAGADPSRIPIRSTPRSPCVDSGVTTAI